LFFIHDSTTVLTSEKINDIEDAEKLLEIYSEDIKDDSQQSLLHVAMVSKLAKILNGRFSVVSSKAEGTNYTVEIPIKLGRQASFSSGKTPDAPIKILLVEDHFLNQIATKKVLTTWSLMDIQMPVMNGIEATKKIRTTSQVPIIALTANASKQESDKCINAGMNDYLSKPFKPQELYAKIMNTLVLVEA